MQAFVGDASDGSPMTVLDSPQSRGPSPSRQNFSEDREGVMATQFYEDTQIDLPQLCQTSDGQPVPEALDVSDTLHYEDEDHTISCTEGQLSSSAFPCTQAYVDDATDQFSPKRSTAATSAVSPVQALQAYADDFLTAPAASTAISKPASPIQATQAYFDEPASPAAVRAGGPGHFLATQAYPEDLALDGVCMEDTLQYAEDFGDISEDLASSSCLASEAVAPEPQIDVPAASCEVLATQAYMDDVESPLRHSMATDAPEENFASLGTASAFGEDFPSPRSTLMNRQPQKQLLSASSSLALTPRQMAVTSLPRRRTQMISLQMHCKQETSVPFPAAKPRILQHSKGCTAVTVAVAVVAAQIAASEIPLRTM